MKAFGTLLWGETFVLSLQSSEGLSMHGLGLMPLWPAWIQGLKQILCSELLPGAETLAQLHPRTGGLRL